MFQLKPKASDEQRRDALRQLRQEKLPGERESRYLVAQQRVAGLLAGGVPVKASRKRGVRLKKVDPAELTAGNLP